MKPTSSLSLITALLLGTAAFAAAADSQSNTTNAKDTSMTTSQEPDHYTFELSAKVTRQKVTFANRYGIRLTGDLYLPKNQEGATLPAIAISGPFGAVKEQSSGLYANAMAERGYAVLAFDPSYTGESGGEPRNIASPDINTEDFSAAVDYLGLNPRVDRNRIGILGICGFGGFALNATAVDKRIKAVATSTMYDMTRVASKGYNDSRTLAERTQMHAVSRFQTVDRSVPGQGVTPGADHADEVSRRSATSNDRA